MPIDACAPQCQRDASSKCRHPELKMTFPKQLVNSDGQFFLFPIFPFCLVCSKRQDLLETSHSRRRQAAATQLIPRGKSTYCKPRCTLAVGIRNQQSCKFRAEKEIRKAPRSFQSNTTKGKEKKEGHPEA